MTHAVRFVAVVAVLTALAQCVPVQAQTPGTHVLRARAEAGDAEAQVSLGIMYTTGRGVPQDYVEAARWYRLAADQGNATAQNNLGVMYGTGEGVPEDDAWAVHWFRVAADQGYADAQAHLALRYAYGLGVPQDYVQAHMWYNLLASQATIGLRESGVRGRDRVAGQMTPTQITEAQRLAHEWGHAHPR